MIYVAYITIAVALAVIAVAMLMITVILIRSRHPVRLAANFFLDAWLESCITRTVHLVHAGGLEGSFKEPTTAAGRRDLADRIMQDVVGAAGLDVHAFHLPAMIKAKFIELGYDAENRQKSAA